MRKHWISEWLMSVKLWGEWVYERQQDNIQGRVLRECAEQLAHALPHQSLAKLLHRAMSSARYLSFTRTVTYECCLLVDHPPGGGEKTDPSHRYQHPHVYLAAGLPQWQNSLCESGKQHLQLHLSLHCLLSPMLFTLMTHDCSAASSSNHMIRNANETTVVGLIMDNTDLSYRGPVQQSWMSRRPRTWSSTSGQNSPVIHH